MLISALCSYYDTLAKSGRLEEKGFTNQDVSYMIFLNPDGSVADIIDYFDEITVEMKKGTAKKKVKKKIRVPVHPVSTSVKAYLLDYRSEYIFGYEKSKKEKEKSIFFHKEKRDACVEKNLEFISGIDAPVVNAYRNFLLNWEKPESIDDTVYKKVVGSTCCFALNGHPELQLQNDSEIIKRCRENIAETDADDCEIGTCSITGEEMQPIARLHNKIRGIRNGQASGTTLVCFNNPSDESYGKSQSVNSSISVAAAEKYVDALNYLLRENAHHTCIDDLTMVYWADADNSEEDGAACDLFSYFCLSAKSDRADTDNRLSAIMSKLRTGTVSADDLAADGIDPSVNFYVAGLTPNSSRVSVKFVYRNSVGKLVGNIAAHQRDLWHSGLDENRQLSVRTLTNELYSPKISPSERKPPYPLYAALMESILNGARYPRALLSTVVQRCKTDSDDEAKKFYSVNSRRVAIIKACLNRKARFMKKREVISMALDTENNSQAYVCGRIFALLEYAQRKASNGKLNRTIKDAYFTSACAKPSTVFPRLLQLAQHHLEKAENGGYINMLISEAIDKIDGKFPSTLSLDEQGEFIIGYYQQNKSIYTKAE